MKKLALITVVFKNYTILDDYFATLAKQTDSEFHVYVLDLSPDPESYNYPSYVTYIHDKNGGYAFGINQGVKKAITDGYELFCPMNCDVTVKENFVESIKKSITNNPTSIIGAKIYYYPGYEYHKDRYTKNDLGKVLWYAGGITDWKNVYTTHRGVDEVDKGQYDAQEKTTFITGCLMAYDKSVVEKIGYWDESYFLFYEDADYCTRAMNNRVPLLYDPSICMWHKSGQSTSGAASTFQQKYLERNRLKFGLRFAPLRTKFHLIKNFFLRK
ncbi:MAG: glycosyltransferase family 2 protein [Candidatus Roizmanbacteria bacterium]|nr:glycosyltransferase family 2 protein [Candidatus Roizmanbacteria bacterium]